MTQKAKMDERDNAVEILNNRLAVLSQARDELSQELSDQRGKMSETEKRMEGLQSAK
jgi:prefoldin subunit 5